MSQEVWSILRKAKETHKSLPVLNWMKKAMHNLLENERMVAYILHFYTSLCVDGLLAAGLPHAVDNLNTSP